MDGPGDYDTKWSTPDRERQISYDIAYIQNLKKNMQMDLFTKQKQTHRLGEQNYQYEEGKVEGGIDWEFGIDMYTLLYFK